MKGFVRTDLLHRIKSFLRVVGHPFRAIGPFQGSGGQTDSPLEGAEVGRGCSTESITVVGITHRPFSGPKSLPTFGCGLNSLKAATDFPDFRDVVKRIIRRKLIRGEKNYTPYLLITVGMIFLSSGCSKPKKSEVVWNKTFFKMGAQSSPRAADLNGDGILDIIIGAGEGEVSETDHGILALNGASGELLWEVGATAQVAGSATFFDINSDGTSDVIIGGREKVLKALNGKDGTEIWSYSYTYERDPVLRYAKYNFYNCSLIPDQNGDGMQDLLALNGGNYRVPGGVMEGREPGVLMVMDMATGAVLAADTMPDGLESYMSPVCIPGVDNKGHMVLFGTGGETFGGSLYQVPLADLMESDLSGAKELASDTLQGFVAPPVIADISGDGLGDIIAISHNSRIFAIDGTQGDWLWEQSISGTEASGSFAVGFFTEDKTPDLFTVVSEGTFPYYEGARQVMLDGLTGEIVFEDTLGCISLSSPVAYDLDGDGWDEAIMSTTEYDCATGIQRETPDQLDETKNRLVWVDFQSGKIKGIEQLARFKNVFSTPWIGDINQDGWLDIVHCQYMGYGNMYEFMGMQIKRIDLPINMTEQPRWGGYMGTRGDGIFGAPRDAN